MHVVRDWLGHTSVAQTSTYLSGTVKTQHDALRAYEDALQRIATDAKTGGQKRPRSAAKRAEKLNKNAVGRDTPIM